MQIVKQQATQILAETILILHEENKLDGIVDTCHEENKLDGIIDTCHEENPAVQNVETLLHEQTFFNRN